jgi:hypothetical protein
MDDPFRKEASAAGAAGMDMAARGPRVKGAACDLSVGEVRQCDEKYTLSEYNFGMFACFTTYGDLS